MNALVYEQSHLLFSHIQSIFTHAFIFSSSACFIVFIGVCFSPGQSAFVSLMEEHHSFQIVTALSLQVLSSDLFVLILPRLACSPSLPSSFLSPLSALNVHFALLLSKVWKVCIVVKFFIVDTSPFKNSFKTHFSH